MKVQQKVMVFVWQRADKTLLTLRNNPKDPKHGGDRWYVVTGSVEQHDENLTAAARRELKEETGIQDLVLMTDLQHKWEFDSNRGNGVHYVEHAFLATIDTSPNITLNEEHIDWQWLNLDEFLKILHWNEDKTILRRLLSKHIAL